jgi:chaperonin GroEL
MAKDSGTCQEIKYGDAARELMKRGADFVANAVKITLGPEGRNVAIKRAGRPIIVTKDGVTVARAINLKDEYENTGAEFVQEAAGKTNEDGGDGTTVTAILAQAMIGDGLSAVASGASPVFLRRGINKAVEATLAYLTKTATPIKKYEQIKQVASIAANDEEMGTHIANLFNRVGKEGVLVVEESKALGYQEEFVEGMKWERGFVSPYMVTDPARQRCEMDEPLILITDKLIENEQELLPLMERMSIKGHKKLMIVAEDVKGAALTTLIVNGMAGKFIGLAVKLPAIGDYKLETLEDIAAVTGGKVFVDQKGFKLENINLDDLGRARKVMANKDSTIIIGGYGGARRLKQRISVAKHDLKNAEEEYDKSRIKERLARLTGSIAVLKYGAKNETEAKEMKYRIEDSINATRHALEEGIVAGGELAILWAANTIDARKLKLQGDELRGFEIVRSALTQPIKVLAENAGTNGNEVIKKIITGPGNFGFNAATGEYVDLIKAGIIDPVKVVKAAVLNAAAATGNALTTEAVITDVVEPIPSRN